MFCVCASSEHQINLVWLTCWFAPRRLACHFTRTTKASTTTPASLFNKSCDGGLINAGRPCHARAETVDERIEGAFHALNSSESASLCPRVSHYASERETEMLVGAERIDNSSCLLGALSEQSSSTRSLAPLIMRYRCVAVVAKFAPREMCKMYLWRRMFRGIAAHSEQWELGQRGSINCIEISTWVAIDHMCFLSFNKLLTLLFDHFIELHILGVG